MSLSRINNELHTKRHLSSSSLGASSQSSLPASPHGSPTGSRSNRLLGQTATSPRANDPQQSPSYLTAHSQHSSTSDTTIAERRSSSSALGFRIAIPPTNSSAPIPLTGNHHTTMQQQHQQPARSRSISMAATWSSSQEKQRNSFLLAIQPGGILERAALFRRPFDAVFVPRQARLEELQIAALLEAKPNPNYIFDESAPPASARAQLIREGDGLFDPSLVLRIPHEDAKCREFLALFLEHHLGTLDSFGLGPAFSLSCGIRGTITEMLDAISVSGRTADIPIRAHMTPTATAQHAPSSSQPPNPKNTPPTTAADALNIFVIDDTMVDTYDLRKYTSQIAHYTTANSRGGAGDTNKGSAALQRTASGRVVPIRNNGQPTSPAPASVDDGANTTSGALGRFISGLFGGGAPSSQISSEAPAEQTQQTQSAFQRFQQKMQRPESRFLARSVTAFVEYCNGTSTLSSAASANPATAGAIGVANKHKPISPKEVRSVIDQLMQQVGAIKEWHGMEDVALEGFEKYIMTRIYARTFCFIDEDKRESRRFENRLAAFGPYVSERTFELIPHLEDRAQWRQAVVELTAMTDYKCPRDKLVCGMNACRLLIRALEVATALSKQQASGSSNNLLTADAQQQQPPSGPSGVGTADVFLPALFLCLAKTNPPLYVANVKFIDKYRHRTLLDNESGYLLTCLMSAVEFWQNVDADQLGISEELFAAAQKEERALNEKEDWDAVAASQPATARGAKQQLQQPLQPLQQQANANISLSTRPTSPTAEGAPSSNTAAAPNAPTTAIAGDTMATPATTATVSPPITTSAASPTGDMNTTSQSGSSPSQQQESGPSAATMAPTPVNRQHTDPFDSFFNGGGGNNTAVTTHQQQQQPSAVANGMSASSTSLNAASTTQSPITTAAAAIYSSPSSPDTDAAFAKLVAAGGNINGLTIAELQLIASEALRMRGA